jgi:hypothetical protein
LSVTALLCPKAAKPDHGLHHQAPVPVPLSPTTHSQRAPLPISTCPTSQHHRPALSSPPSSHLQCHQPLPNSRPGPWRPPRCPPRSHPPVQPSGPHRPATGYPTGYHRRTSTGSIDFVGGPITRAGVEGRRCHPVARRTTPVDRGSWRRGSQAAAGILVRGGVSPAVLLHGEEVEAGRTTQAMGSW